jgi:hypothetical protein
MSSRLNSRLKIFKKFEFYNKTIKKKYIFKENYHPLDKLCIIYLLSRLRFSLF